MQLSCRRRYRRRPLPCILPVFRPMKVPPCTVSRSPSPQTQAEILRTVRSARSVASLRALRAPQLSGRSHVGRLNVPEWTGTCVTPPRTAQYLRLTPSSPRCSSRSCPCSFVTVRLPLTNAATVIRVLSMVPRAAGAAPRRPPQQVRCVVALSLRALRAPQASGRSHVGRLNVPEWTGTWFMSLRAHAVVCVWVAWRGSSNVLI